MKPASFRLIRSSTSSSASVSVARSKPPPGFGCSLPGSATPGGGRRGPRPPEPWPPSNGTGEEITRSKASADTTSKIPPPTTTLAGYIGIAWWQPSLGHDLGRLCRLARLAEQEHQRHRHERHHHHQLEVVGIGDDRRLPGDLAVEGGAPGLGRQIPDARDEWVLQRVAVGRHVLGESRMHDL